MKDLIQKLEKVTWSTFEKTEAKGKTPSGDDIEVKIDFKFAGRVGEQFSPIEGRLMVYIDGVCAYRHDLIFTTDVEAIREYWLKTYNEEQLREFNEQDDARNAAKMLFNEL